MLALIKEFDEALFLGLLKAAKALREEQNAAEVRCAGGHDRRGSRGDRSAHRKAHGSQKGKGLATADAIRDALAARHIVVKDTPQGISVVCAGLK